uniref:Uncharacterized protein n=1 Tax=Arion vulgaris TaxID=1028688 RepID=A0A0B7B3H0_9EUPU
MWNIEEYSVRALVSWTNNTRYDSVNFISQSFSGVQQRLDRPKRRGQIGILLQWGVLNQGSCIYEAIALTTVLLALL